MKKLITLFVSLLFLIVSNGQEKYVRKSGDPNGIEKWYMGRQIAQVMSHFGIDWLERPERDFEENSLQLLKNLKLEEGMQIADVGAGSGYYSRLISKQIGNGKVFAVDIEPEMIEYLNARSKMENIKNIKTVLCTEKSISLPTESMDIMLLVDVYHEFSFPYEMALSMYKSLKPDGKVVLVEFRAEDDRVPIKEIHKMSEKQAVKEMKVAGFHLDENIKNLPWQHCMIFVKDK